MKGEQEIWQALEGLTYKSAVEDHVQTRIVWQSLMAALGWVLELPHMDGEPLDPMVELGRKIQEGE